MSLLKIPYTEEQLWWKIISELVDTVIEQKIVCQVT